MIAEDGSKTRRDLGVHVPLLIDHESRALERAVEQSASICWISYDKRSVKSGLMMCLYSGLVVYEYSHTSYLELKQGELCVRGGVSRHLKYLTLLTLRGI